MGGMRAVLLATAAGMAALMGAARASSELQTGAYLQTSPVTPTYNGPGRCTLTVGPRDGLGAGQFLLEAGDNQAPDDAEIKLGGTFTTQQVGPRTVYTLTPDAKSAQANVRAVLRKQSNNKSLEVALHTLAASAVAEKSVAICDVKLRAAVSDGGTTLGFATFDFHGPGIYNPSSTGSGAAARRAPVAKVDNNPPCPTTMPQSSALAPLGLAPVPKQCGDASCLVTFAGYQWWTSFQYYGPAGNPVFPNGGYFFNGGLGTPFSPKNSFVDAQGLHLQANMVDLGGGSVPAGAESVLMFTPDGKQANLGYGDYLVTATVTSAADWPSLDPNVAFGVFQFERVGSGSNANSFNPYREIDLAEVSTWGKYPPGKCPYGNGSVLCTGAAQFTLQLWDQRPDNLHRYSLTPGVKTITLVMHWPGANMPVTFSEYDGAYTLSTLPATPTNTWTTAPAQNPYVPESACGRFHLNLWLGNFPAAKQPGGPNPPPAKFPQEVVVSNFQFQPAQ